MTGWICLLAAVLGEIAVPFLLGAFYPGYRHDTMAISVLGSPESPVRWPFRLWMLAAGALFLLAIPGLYAAYAGLSRGLTIAMLVCLAVFALGACVLSCFFSVNATKDSMTPAARVHGIGSAIGFLLMLLVPLFLALLSFRAGDVPGGIGSAVCFALALGSFVLFIMADKPTAPVRQEGLWQRLSLLFMYLPLVAVTAGRMLP